MAHFSFRTWSDAKIARLREMWWDGKTARECALVLGFKSGESIRIKVALEGFERDPALSDRSIQMAAQPREDGTVVTLENCRSKECRWICETTKDREAILCGRKVDRGTLCAVHWKRAHTPEKVSR